MYNDEIKIALMPGKIRSSRCLERIKKTAIFWEGIKSVPVSWEIKKTAVFWGTIKENHCLGNMQATAVVWKTYEQLLLLEK